MQNKAVNKVLPFWYVKTKKVHELISSVSKREKSDILRVYY